MSKAAIFYISLALGVSISAALSIFAFISEASLTQAQIKGAQSTTGSLEAEKSAMRSPAFAPGLTKEFVESEDARIQNERDDQEKTIETLSNK